MLNDDDLQTLRDIGYVRKRAVIGAQELGRLDDACARLLDARAQQQSAFPQDFKRPAAHEPLGRIEYLFEKDDAFLALAAHPALLTSVERLYAAEFAVTWEDLLIKAARVGFLVYPHQDSLYQSRRSPVYRFGIYLDRSHAAPIRFVPGSHRLGALSAAQIAEVTQARLTEEQQMPAEAGDVIVHDTLVIHASDVHRHEVARRVIYLEYRTLEQLRLDSPWGAGWIARRRELLPIAAKTRAQLCAFDGEGAPLGPIAAASITPVDPSRLEGTHLRIDHDDTENLAWHGLARPEEVHA